MCKKRNLLLAYLFLLSMSIVFAFPFYFLVVSATNASIDVTNGRLLFGGHLFNNLSNLFTQTQMLQAITNSVIISVIQTVFTILIGSAAGYGFEIYQTKWSDRLFRLILLSMMIPFAAIMIPLFRLFGQMTSFSSWRGVNSYASVYLPYLATAFMIFFFRQNTKSFSKDLLEAARMDGISEISCFFRIYIPAMKTTYAAAGIIAFMNSWNNYIWPLIVIQSSDKQTIPLLISNLGSSYSPDFGLIMIAVLIATIPILVIFFVLQKYFVVGMLGSDK